jgi:two-component system sensor histidine kinase/response regulator
MKHLQLLVALLATSFFPCSSRAQSIQQLRAKLTDTTSDETRCDIYYSLSRYYWSKDADSVLRLADSALASARRVHYDKGVAQAFLSKGIAYELKEEHVYALNCHLEALRISDRLGLDGLTGDLYSDIGIVYAHLGDYSRAREYYASALEIAKKNKDQYQTSILLTNISEAFKHCGAYDSALAYNSKALPIICTLHDSVVIAAILLNIGDDYDKMGHPDTALTYFARCEAIALLVHDEEDIAWAGISRAEALQQQHKYGLSIRYATTALSNARRFSFAEVIHECYSVLCTDYRANRNFQRALQYRDLEVNWKDSLNSMEREKKISSLQSGYELEKKQHQIDLLNKDRLFQQQEIAAERQRHVMFAAIALFFSMWALFLLRSNREKEKLNRLLRTRNHDLLQES